MKRDGINKSIWQETLVNENVQSNSYDIRKIYDVVIVGAGITGISTGLQLQKAGKSVLIAEAYNIGFGTTGGTTAHLNTFLDSSYGTIKKKFNQADAQLVADAVQASLAFIKNNVHSYQIDCDYKELPAYLFSNNEDQTKELEEIFTSAQEVSVPVVYTKELPVPMEHEKVLSFSGQAQFHPLRYLEGIARAFTKQGGIILENCRVTGLEEKDILTIESSLGAIQAHHLIYATHIPPGVNLLHLRCAPYRSYAMAIQLTNEHDYPDALVYDMEDPYHYFRTQEIDGEKYLIVGGEDHKTGHELNTESCFLKLESFVRKYFDVKTVAYKWSSQYFEPADGLAYIGHLPGSSEEVMVATGYGGNGMVYSGIAALLLPELILTGKSKYEELFDPNRIKMVAGFKNFITEAADVVQKLIGSLIPAQALEVLADMAPGEARIVKYQGNKLAIYKDQSGKIHAVNPACTHIKCDVAWNLTEQSWDCPCHGSRFDSDGKVLTAPARKDLEVINIGSLSTDGLS